MEEKNFTDLKNPQVIMSWAAPLRPYIKRNPQVLRFYLAVALLISLIVFFLGDKILLIPIWTLLFLFYVLTISPPPEIENKITQFGVETAGATWRWETLDSFYYNHRLGYDILVIISHPPYLFHSHLVIPNEEVKKKTAAILSQHLIYQESPKKTTVNKLIDWFSNLVTEEVSLGMTQTPVPPSP